MTVTENATQRRFVLKKAGHAPAVPAFPFPTEPIERRSGISREEYDKTYQLGDCRPVIITDALDSWPARQKWTFNFFRKQYGDGAVQVGQGLGSPRRQTVNFSEYLTYCELPFATSLIHIPSPTPLYLFTFKPFRKHPELLEDFSPPYFEENCYGGLTGVMRDWYVEHFSWLFIGPRGTLSPLHVDLFQTHAWLAQLQGRKHCLLVSPQDRAYFQENMVLTNPDPNSYSPQVKHARPLEGILEPGETLFVPRGWGHHVISLSPSITLSFNYVNHSNYMDHLLGICHEVTRWVGMANESDFAEAVRQRCD